MTKLFSKSKQVDREKSLLVVIQFLVGAFMLLIGVGLGWWLKGSTPPVTKITSPLRLGGYEFISPLLACDTNPSVNSASLNTLEDRLKSVINDRKKTADVDQVSVYYRELKTGKQLTVNGGEKYFPASLKKVPIMMSYYKRAEDAPDLLSTKGVLQGSIDYNLNVEVPPKVKPIYGQEYSVDDLINMMIRYSDNNSFMMLSNNTNEEDLKTLYNTIQVNYPDDQLAIADYITPYQFSFFLRILYNSTYLNAAYSEKALKLMSEVDFKDGIVAGVPSNVRVAHKFGDMSNKENSQINFREMHDCGIVYNPTDPYILCVMTKSHQEITKTEDTIKQISEIAFKASEENN